MRTTLIINDEVLAEAKQLATERKSSLSALVNDALRRMIQQSSQHPKTPFRIPIYGRGHTVTDSSPTELANLEDPASFDPYSK